MPDLFAPQGAPDAPDPAAPLAARMRPRSVAEFHGQQHLLGEGKPLRRAAERGEVHSMLFWGPPGVGKTTLARLLAGNCGAHFVTLSAVMAGVKEVRAAVAEAQQRRATGGRTVLFIDEVHRFNKAQQDAFLPFVEDGTVTFMGATTENPSFEVNNALLSRARVYRLRSLDADELAEIATQALGDAERGLGELGLTLAEDALAALTTAADGDARRLLNLVDLAAQVVEPGSTISADDLDEVLAGEVRRFDKGGDAFYDQISALHKAVRGSAPDAALYWFARMVDGGCDPLYVARRVVRMASEDIGNADPRALRIALDAWETFDRLGSPEGELAIAQAIAYLAVAPKSNAVYSAWNAVLADVRSGASHEVPMHLRNAPTRLMKDEGHGAGYRYAHDEPDGYAAGVEYLPDALAGTRWYNPVPRGMELKIGEKLARLRALDAAERGGKG